MPISPDIYHFTQSSPESEGSSLDWGSFIPTSLGVSPGSPASDIEIDLEKMGKGANKKEVLICNTQKILPQGLRRMSFCSRQVNDSVVMLNQGVNGMRSNIN